MAHVMKIKATSVSPLIDHYERVRAGTFNRSNIDPTRTHLNYNLCDRGQPLEYIDERIKALNLKRAVRKDAVKMIDTVVTLPQGYTGDVRAFMGAVKETLDGIFGAENCAGAWVHLDETTPHMHYASVPVTEDGRLSAKSLLTRAFMREFHPQLEKGVCEHLGIERAGLTLTDEQRQERAGRYVGLAEYKSAHLAVEGLERKIESKELEREELNIEVAALTERAEELRKALSGLQAQFDTLVRHLAEIADAMKVRMWPGDWQKKLEALRDNPIAKNALRAGQPWEWESDYKRADKSIKKDVKQTGYRLDDIKKKMSRASRALENQPFTRENRSSWER